MTKTTVVAGRVVIGTLRLVIMQRFGVLLSVVLALGCGFPAASDRNDAGIRDRKPQFAGANREHAKRAIALATTLSTNDYLLAKYIDDENGTIFSSDHLQEFICTGFLPDGMHLKPHTNLNVGWRIDARVHVHDGAAPNTPWFYRHCFLQYYGDGRISENDITKIRDEWQRMRATFGKTLHAGGDRLLKIAWMVQSAPEQFESTPYVDIRNSDTANYCEVLAHADDYWLHVFITDSIATETSIITISFSPLVDRDPAIPPDVNENPLTSPIFTTQRPRSNGYSEVELARLGHSVFVF